jgi:ParB/Sulfiredoxin domain
MKKRTAGKSALQEPYKDTLNPIDLQFDPQNPRLSSEEEGSSQDRLLRIMLDRFKIEELAESIVAAGFVEFDPMIGWENKGSVVILEGNRRLAALKLLLKPDLAPESYRPAWRDLSQRVPSPNRAALKSIRVIVYKDREAAGLTSYIGFRHVTGVLQWPALEKASFIARCLEKGTWDYVQLARRLGSYPKHVERHYVAHQLVVQATDEGIDTTELKAKSFGVLMRALQSEGVTKYLGIAYPGDPRKSRRPISESNLDNLRNFIEWTFGTSEKAPVVRDSRQLTRWGRILQSAEALSYLKRTSQPDLERAYFRSGGQAESLSESLGIAADRLEESVPLVPEHTNDSDVKAEVRRCTSFLIQILSHFPDISNQYKLRIDKP